MPRSSFELLDFVVLMTHSIIGEALTRGALMKMFYDILLPGCELTGSF
jgi:hypothetical protein